MPERRFLRIAGTVILLAWALAFTALMIAVVVSYLLGNPRTDVLQW